MKTTPTITSHGLSGEISFRVTFAHDYTRPRCIPFHKRNSIMSDTAAFFAKKKKKKAFKGFNANKIDASTVTNAVHVDAPALSNNIDTVAGVGATLSSTTLNDATQKNNSLEAAGGSAEGDQWDDAALAATLTKKPTGVAPPEKLLDMKALETSKVDDDIAEKMRVEDIKAQLKAAKEGMEREAERIKQEEEQKKEASEFKTAGRFGAAASGMGGEGGKYVPRHMRGGGASAGGARPGWGSGVTSSMPRNVDTKDENLFPDLATADNILEQQKKQELAVKKVAPKKQPLSGASWAARRAAASSAAPSKPKEEPAPPAPVEEKKPEKEEVKPEPVAPKPATGSAAATAAAGGGLKKKKKKKKDLSTFKPTG